LQVLFFKALDSVRRDKNVHLKDLPLKNIQTKDLETETIPHETRVYWPGSNCYFQCDRLHELVCQENATHRLKFPDRAEPCEVFVSVRFYR
jgi:hypothetical protein